MLILDLESGTPILLYSITTNIFFPDSKALYGIIWKIRGRFFAILGGFFGVLHDTSDATPCRRQITRRRFPAESQRVSPAGRHPTFIHPKLQLLFLQFFSVFFFIISIRFLLHLFLLRLLLLLFFFPFRFSLIFSFLLFSLSCLCVWSVSLPSQFPLSNSAEPSNELFVRFKFNWRRVSLVLRIRALSAATTH